MPTASMSSQTAMLDETKGIELAHRLKDVKFYLETFTKIKGKQPGQLIPFILNEAQKDLFNAVNGNSRVIILKARQIGFCLTPGTRVLSIKPLGWKTLEEVEVGDQLVAVDEKVPGHRGLRKMRIGTVEGKFEVYAKAYRLTMTDGRSVTATGEHRFLSKKRGHTDTSWVEVKSLMVGDPVKYMVEPDTYGTPDNSYDDGWFAGMLDGEGCLRAKKNCGAELCVSQVDGPVWDRVRSYLDARGYHYRVEVDRRKPVDSSKLGTKNVNRAVIGRMEEIFRILLATRPSRFADRTFWEGKALPGKRNGGCWANIGKIEELGPQRMIDLQTSETSYIAEGFVSHNSTAMVGYFYHKTVTTPGTNTALIGYNSDMAAELLDKVKLFYKTTPAELRPTLHYNSKYEISFPNLESKITVLPSTDEVGRGYTIHNCLCLSGSAEVLTPDFLPKRVDGLSVGDSVLAGDGKPAKVRRIVNSPLGARNLIRVSPVGLPGLTLTEEHEVLVASDGKPEWRKAGELVKGDEVLMPKMSLTHTLKEVEFDHSVINPRYRGRCNRVRNKKLDYAFGRFCGWYLSEGYVHAGSSGIHFCISSDEVEFVLSELRKAVPELLSDTATFRKGSHYRVVRRRDSKSVTVSINSKVLAQWLAGNFGRLSDGKFLPEWLWTAGQDFALGVFDGWLLGDGSFRDVHCVQGVTTSPRLAWGLSFLGYALGQGWGNLRVSESRRYGKRGKVRYDLNFNGANGNRIKRRLGFPEKVYKDSLKSHSRLRQRDFGEGWIAFTVYSLERAPREETVYDIEVDREPHSFVSSLGVAKNCTELAFWDNAEDKMTTLENSVPSDGKLVIESCVTADTLVFTDGGVAEVGDVHDWENRPDGFSEGRGILIDGHYGPKSTSIYYSSGVRDGFRIRTKSGYGLGMSSVHKMMLYVSERGGFEFREAKDIREGDLLCVRHGQEMWGNDDDISSFVPSEYGFNKKGLRRFCTKKLTPDLSYLLGLILGDGYVFRSKYVVITTTDDDVSDFLLSAPLGLKFMLDKDGSGYHYRCTNKSFAEFLRWFGFSEGVKAPQKKFPRRMLRASRENVRAFLQGLYDADGHCSSDRGTVGLTSTSRDIIDVVQVVLLNFGLVARTYGYDMAPTKKVSVWSKCFRLEMNYAESDLFRETVGFRITRKQGAHSGRRKERGKIVPGVGRLLHDRRVELGLSVTAQSGLSSKGLFSDSGNMSYRSLAGWLSRCRNTNSGLFKSLREVCNRGYLIEPVVSKDSMRERVYDFTVEDGHTVTYSGLVGHQTPNGVGNLYHRLWMNTDNDYVKKEYGWWWGYAKDEVDIIRKRMNNPRKFAQEYELDFVSSGRPVFDFNMVKKMREEILKVGEKRKLEDGTEFEVKEEDGLRVYQEPELDIVYVCGVDVSEGVEDGDYSVVSFFRRDTGEEVAMYRGLMAPDRLADKLNEWGRRYNKALMVVEINNHGLTTVTSLKNLIYPSIYFRPAKFEVTGTPISNKLGWKTTRITRPLMIDELAQFCRDGLIVPHSKELLDEMSTFVYDDNGNMVPMPGFHDDCVFSGALAIQGFKVTYHDRKLTQLDYSSYLPNSSPY